MHYVQIRPLQIGGSRARPRNSISDLAQTARYWTHLGIFGYIFGYNLGLIRVYIGIYGYNGSPLNKEGKRAGIAREIGKVRPLSAKA